MKIIGKKSLSTVIKIGLQIVLIVGILVIIGLPFLLHLYVTWINPYLSYYPALILLYVSGIPALIIVKQFIAIFETLKEENPFNHQNVTYLKRVSICSFIIAIEYLIGLFVTKSIFSLVMIGVFVIAWLGIYILAELLKQAIQYKEENELTI